MGTCLSLGGEEVAVPASRLPEQPVQCFYQPSLQVPLGGRLLQGGASLASYQGLL
jgi:hypothetical protein